MPRPAAVLLVLMFCLRTLLAGPVFIPLWDGPAPGAYGTDPERDVPRVYPFLPDGVAPNGCAIVICPGGGYSNLFALATEGFEAALWFAQRGFACFVLRYRLGGDGYAYPVMTADIKRAMRLVRSRARQWGIDTARIGVMGFSAGGHLASTVSTHFDNGDPQAADTVDRVSCRPAFSLLIYAVITMDPRWTYELGVGEFFGTNQPPQALIDSFSSEKQVTANTPPAFLASGAGDGTVNEINSYMYRDSCLAHGVTARFMSLGDCTHGSGLCGYWADTSIGWLTELGILQPRAGVVAQRARRAWATASGQGISSLRRRGSVPLVMYDISGRTVHGVAASRPGMGVWLRRGTLSRGTE